MPMETYMNTVVLCAGVYVSFNGYLNPIGPAGFHRIRYLYYSQSNRFISNTTVWILSLATKLPSNRYSSNSDLSSCSLTVHLAMIQLSTCLATLASDWNSKPEFKFRAPDNETEMSHTITCEFSGECVVLNEY